MSELIEKLAELEHSRWSGWMAYLFMQGTFNDDGSFTIERESVNRWKRQAMTPYSALTEEEKESDRKEVRRALVLMASFAEDTEGEE